MNANQLTKIPVEKLSDTLQFLIAENEIPLSDAFKQVIDDVDAVCKKLLRDEPATAQPVIPEQPQAELKIGTSKNAWPYYVAQCPKCGWLGSSADCLGDEESCDCPLCYADADEVDAETAFNVMLDAINELRASTAQPVSEPYKLDGLNIRAVAALREAVRKQWLKSDNFGDKVYWKSMHSIANEIVEVMLAAAPTQESE